MTHHDDDPFVTRIFGDMPPIEPVTIERVYVLPCPRIGSNGRHYGLAVLCGTCEGKNRALSTPTGWVPLPLGWRG